MDIPHMPFLFAVTESMGEIIFTHCPILGGAVVCTVEVSISDGSRPTHTGLGELVHVASHELPKEMS